ncbi:MAG: hypothetical protein JST11_08050 [Acidobacteria bacterium]|nr:hypothetical protein [Acidobacteriota bacterium]
MRFYDGNRMGTGSPGASPYRGNLDGLDNKLTTGDEARVNFEATPEPSAAVLSALPLWLWLMMKRRRR